ncbi:RpiR family transcriptional regulator, glv operon transcriptional regulator [Enterococcus sp. DIV0724b]|uniref:MurR/RpiR family transcriptional regulator n=1 Tax=Enterococcus sp. DIV0724b TaxID=2774694 RepID=UPI003D30007E
MKFQQLLQNKMGNFSDTDKTICAYIYNHQELIPETSITKLAEYSYTSKSSVLRFVQKLGFKGYSEFKYLIDWHGVQDNLHEMFSIDHLTDYLNTVLSNIKEDTLISFFELLRNTPKIYLLATGTDQQIQAQNFARAFLKMNVVCTLIPGNSNVELANIVLDNINEHDLIIVFSGSGNNSQINELMTVPLLKATPIVSITVTEKNWLNEHSLLNFSILAKSDGPMMKFSSGICHLLIDFLAHRFRLYIECLLTKSTSE